MLLLVGVVVAAVSLGSGLHSSPTSVRAFYGSGINSTRAGGWTGYAPLHNPASRQQVADMCVSLRATIRNTPRPYRRDLRRAIRLACSKHR